MTSESKPKGTVQRPVLEWMMAHPGQKVGRRDVAREVEPPTDYRNQSDWEKAAGQALNQLAATGRIGRVDYGVYIYPPDLAPPFVKFGHGGSRPRQPVDDTPDDLKPLTEAINDDAFKAVGLRPIAQAADGARICVDDQGTAWKVRVMVEARLI